MRARDTKYFAAGLGKENVIDEGRPLGLSRARAVTTCHVADCEGLGNEAKSGDRWSSNENAAQALYFLMSKRGRYSLLRPSAVSLSIATVRQVGPECGQSASLESS